MLSERFGEAARWASELHAGHVRKGTAIPYVSHLFAVAALVLEDGGSEDEAIAALLHDAVEDDKTALSEIEARFGVDVAAMVKACSDTTEIPKPPWRGRKERYIAHLHDPATTSGALRVSAADKLHNARSLLADYLDVGEALWTRFNADAQSADAQLWYYTELVKAFVARRPDGRLTQQLTAVVAELAEAADWYGPPPDRCPACASADIIKILYGMPLPPEPGEPERDVEWAGCIVTDDAPLWRCRGCGQGIGNYRDQPTIQR